MKSYTILDSGCGQKLEQVGPIRLVRPCAQAVWRRQLPLAEWEKADARFSREGAQEWEILRSLPEQWQVELSGLTFWIRPTPFGHIGLFPEQAPNWSWIQQVRPARLLNLFAYSGGVSLAAAKTGAEVCHVDASKGMVSWARENADLNHLDQIRWIVDDVKKFLKREERRGRTYDALVLDPPTYGRGAKGEVFKIEEDLPDLLDLCRAVLDPTPRFVLLSCHTPSYTPAVLEHLLCDMMGGGSIESGELFLPGARPVPSGAFGRWTSPA